MARFTFGSSSGDLVTQAASSNSGIIKAAANYNAVGTFWSAQTGGTQYTDLVDPNNGFVAITGISTDANGRPKAFQGPDGVYEGWVDFGGGRFKMEAVESGKFVTPATIGNLAAPLWQPSTAYTAGHAVVNPSGDVVTAKANFTSGSTYNSANWNPSATTAAVNGLAKKPPFVTGANLTVGWTGALPIEYHNGQLWGISGTNIQTSSDDGVTWTTVATAPAGSVCRLLWCSDGEVILTNSAVIWKSTGWAANPATATWTVKVTKTVTTGVGILPWGIDGNGTKFIATEYSGPDRSESRYIWVSVDSGATWTIAYDKYISDPTNTSHMHGVCYDPWEDRFWVSHGHGVLRGMYYAPATPAPTQSSWTMLTGPFQPDAAPCAMIATDDGIVLGSDSVDAGMYGIPRAPLARMQLRRTTRWSVIEDGVTGFANRAYRDPNTGIVYIGFKSDFATVSSGVAAGGARAAEFIWLDSPSVAKSVNPLVTNDGTLIAYVDRTGSYDLLTAQTLAPGSIRFDTGGVDGGVTNTGTALAVGAASAAILAARFSVAVGVGAQALNQGWTAVGYKAGATSPSTGLNATIIGSNAYAADNGTATGAGATAVSNAIAHGSGTSATQSFSENIGARFRVRKRLSGDAHPAVPAPDEAQDYTIMVNGRLNSYHQTRDGRRVQTSNYGILATVIGINAKTVGTTALVTVPAAATMVVTQIVIRCTAATAITGAPSVNVGVTAGDQMPSTALTGLTVGSKTWMFTPSGLGTVASSGQVLNLGIDVASVGTTHTLAVDVLGYLL